MPRRCADRGMATAVAGSQGASLLDRPEVTTLAVPTPVAQGHSFSEAYAHLPVSSLMLHLARDWPAERITLGEMIHAFGTRGYGLLIILFAIPNLIPIYIPGWSPISSERAWLRRK